ncbi:hypothetical protein YTPLAS18_05750 [Nitrospira sp.]|nr:hypothetical protein YTPLAS18_05750 [Nitrospira sp.]
MVTLCQQATSVPHFLLVQYRWVLSPGRAVREQRTRVVHFAAANVIEMDTSACPSGYGLYPAIVTGDN